MIEFLTFLMLACIVFALVDINNTLKQIRDRRYEQKQEEETDT